MQVAAFPIRNAAHGVARGKAFLNAALVAIGYSRVPVDIIDRIVVASALVIGAHVFLLYAHHVKPFFLGDFVVANVKVFGQCHCVRRIA